MPGWNVDPNEIFAWLTATSNVTLLQQVQQAVGARLTDLQQAQGGQAAHAVQPHVQPTNVGMAAERAQPMTGPDPAPGNPSIFEQAAANQETEQAQRRSYRGPAPSPVSVQVGPEDEERSQESEQALAEYQKEAAEANKVEIPGGQGGGQGGGEGQEQPARVVYGGEPHIGSGQQAQGRQGATVPGRLQQGQKAAQGLKEGKPPQEATGGQFSQSENAEKAAQEGQKTQQEPNKSAKPENK